jgi:hypothetical protein
MCSSRRVILLLIIASVAVHVVALLAAHLRTGRIDGYAFASLDCREYYAIARNVARHAAFSQGEAPPLRPDTWRTPGYPAFLAALMAVFGDSPATLIVAQQVLAILNVLLVFRMAARWLSERRAAVVAALFLVEPYRVYYSLWLLATTLFTTVLLAGWYVWARASEGHNRGWTWCALLGAIAGLLVLVAPVAILVPVVVAVGVAMSASCGAKKMGGHDTATALKQSLWPLGLFAVGCLLVVGSWMTRNLIVAGRFALSDQGGVVLAYFKTTEIELWRQGRVADRYLETSLDPAKVLWPHTVWDEIDARLQDKLYHLPADQRVELRWANLAQGNRTRADSFEVSDALSEIGWSYLWQSPLDTAVCCLVRCASLLTFPINLALKPPRGVEIDRFASLLKGGVYLALCVWVLVGVLRGRMTFAATYFPLACTIALLLATTPQLDPRFRVPMIPLLLFVALMPSRRL